jgi:HD superfamily phosphohydrolase
MDVPHEAMSIAMMEAMNEEYGGALDLALRIFKGSYPKKFLHQLVSSQLDMDRMDYLSRDSFYTGVNEGIIGYNRLLQMLNVHEGELVIGIKGIYSVEKFLIARRLMYWQVYLHKTVVMASEMNVQAVRRAKDLLTAGERVPMSEALHFFLSQNLGMSDLRQAPQPILAQFEALDDVDLLAALKVWAGHSDPVLRLLSQSLLQRRLFAIHPVSKPLEEAEIQVKRSQYGQSLGLKAGEMSYLLGQVQEANKAYQKGKKELKILQKDGTVQPISHWAEHHIPDKEVVKYFWYHPRV